MTKADITIESGIVVGHDGSEASSAAVRKAADLAAGLGLPLHVVRAWTLTSGPRPASMTGGYVPPNEDFAQAALDELAAQVESLGLTGVTPELHAVRGNSSNALLESSTAADMLVVGARGAGGFLGLVMGSTADQVVRYAKIPVLVVPAPEH